MAVLALIVGAGAVYAVLSPGLRGASGEATPRQNVALEVSGPGLPAGATNVQDFGSLLADFEAAQEASLVALRGYLLTDGEGFHREWLQASARLQAASDMLGRQSSTWTDGRKLVELVEMQRLVDQLLAEQRAVASIVGTVNRYPGLQLYTEDVKPALGEAQALCTEIMDAMLAISSPDVVGPVGPFATFRGDLDDLRTGLADFMAVSRDATLPEVASDTRFDAMLKTLADVRPQIPVEMREKIDRLASLIGTVQEKLDRVFALRKGERWDYAEYAFRTRIEPLAVKLDGIGTTWRESAGRQARADSSQSQSYPAAAK
ncbi:MAG: hypothetical protein H5U13_07785 [Parvibaculum sp.]|nr:hypothetical protein [Parvibaculum sp.]